MELEVTWKRAVKVWWSYLWRNVLAVAGAMIVSSIVGAILGFVLTLAGLPRDIIQNVATPIGLLIGILFSIIPIKLILGKDFGEFRLVLIENTANENT